MSLSRLLMRFVLSVSALAFAAPLFAQEGVLRVYLARHGITDWNVATKVQGATDNPLNETGRKQAAALVERLKGVPLDHIYTTALVRTKQTAEGIANVKQTAIAGLNERHHGKFEGIVDDPKTNADMSAEYRKRIRIADDSLDGGESLADQHKRVGAATRDILARHKKGGSILIVGHGGTNPQIVAELLGLTPTDALTRVRQANDEIYLFELRAGSPPMVWKNITMTTLEEL
jgi:2,3-bisphosphoglycerate-dependent phosphoglycerate mutase